MLTIAIAVLLGSVATAESRVHRSFGTFDASEELIKIEKFMNFSRSALDGASTLQAQVDGEEDESNCFSSSYCASNIPDESPEIWKDLDWCCCNGAREIESGATENVLSICMPEDVCNNDTMPDFVISAESYDWTCGSPASSLQISIALLGVLVAIATHFSM